MDFLKYFKNDLKDFDKKYGVKSLCLACKKALYSKYRINDTLRDSNY